MVVEFQSTGDDGRCVWGLRWGRSWCPAVSRCLSCCDFQTICLVRSFACWLARGSVNTDSDAANEPTGEGFNARQKVFLVLIDCDFGRATGRVDNSPITSSVQLPRISNPAHLIGARVLAISFCKVDSTARAVISGFLSISLTSGILISNCYVASCGTVRETREQNVPHPE